MCKYFLFSLLLLSFIFSHPALAQIDTLPQSTPAQTEDKEDKIKRRQASKGPRRALFLSAIAPGMGQIYNKKYWKPPIIWVGLGIAAYFYLNNEANFQDYNKEYKKQYAINPNGIFPVETMRDKQRVSSVNQLYQGTNTFRKYRDMSLIIGAVIYVLNIVDANVDAHLKEFDIGEELSLRISPLLYANINRQFTTGITLNFTFKK